MIPLGKTTPTKPYQGSIKMIGILIADKNQKKLRRRAYHSTSLSSLELINSDFNNICFEIRIGTPLALRNGHIIKKKKEP